MPTVTASGHAEQRLPVARAVVSGRLEASDVDREAALAEVVEGQERVRAAVTETPSFEQVRSHTFEHEDRVRRHTVTVGFEVVVDGAQRVAAVVEALAGAGADLHGQRWEGPEDVDHAEVVARAVAAARRRAVELAAGAGHRLGDLVAVTDGSSGGPVGPRPLRAVAHGEGLELEPRGVTISANATVTYELLPLDG